MIRGNNGNTLIELLIGAGLATVFALLSFYWIGWQNEAQMITERQLAILDVRASLLNNLNNAHYWNAIKATEPSFQCIRDNVPCTLAPKGFNVVDASGAQTLRAFSPIGARCAGVDCMAVYDVVWIPMCIGGAPCVPTQVQITGTLNILNPDYLPVTTNSQNSRFTLIRSVE